MSAHPNWLDWVLIRLNSSSENTELFHKVWWLYLIIRGPEKNIGKKNFGHFSYFAWRGQFESRLRQKTAVTSAPNALVACSCIVFDMSKSSRVIGVTNFFHFVTRYYNFAPIVQRLKVPFKFKSPKWPSKAPSDLPEAQSDPPNAQSDGQRPKATSQMPQANSQTPAWPILTCFFLHASREEWAKKAAMK